MTLLPTLTTWSDFVKDLYESFTKVWLLKVIWMFVKRLYNVPYMEMLWAKWVVDEIFGEPFWKICENFDEPFSNIQMEIWKFFETFGERLWNVTNNLQRNTNNVQHVTNAIWNFKYFGLSWNKLKHIWISWSVVFINNKSKARSNVTYL